jgi:hypothetical protein
MNLLFRIYELLVNLLVNLLFRIYPLGSFLNIMHQPNYPPQSQGENFHFIGQNMAFNPISPPNSASSYGTPSPQSTEQAMQQETSTTKPMKQRSLRYWTHEEEERLASSWLEISKDPIHRNDKKGDTFWKEITSEFNRKGNGKRTWELNQLKVHWSRLKTAIGEWNDYWTKVTQMHTSGYSDDMLEEEAQKMYANRHRKNFTLIHWWKILKDEPKWCAQFETEKDKKDSIEVVEIPDAQKRPPGREAAKAERRGKRKKENVKDGIVILGEDIDKIVKVEEDRKMERDKVTAAQIQISNANLKAAQEHKEAKMFEVYNSLITQDTMNMSEEAKASREKAIRKLEEKLFGA